MPELAANEISQAKLADLLKLVAEDMIAAEDTFQSLDAALGDGDLGITVRMGFQAIREVCQKNDPTQPSGIGSLLSAAGKAFMNANASTMGTLMGTAWVQAGKIAALKTTITLEDAVAMCRAAAEGIQRRGKAQLGDKTILDAIFPASEALAKASADGKGLFPCCRSRRTGRHRNHSAPVASQPGFLASGTEQRFAGPRGIALCRIIAINGQPIGDKLICVSHTQVTVDQIPPCRVREPMK
jgi:phosphoenolpyruvate---glycerone phosphotransferase subunit DhaL